MNGKKLQEIVWDSGLKIKQLVKESGIPEQTIYSLYKKKEVDEYYIKKLSATSLGKFLHKEYKNSNEEERETHEPQVMYAGLSDQQTNSMLALLEKLADSVVADNTVFRQLITRGLERDAIVFDSRKAGVKHRDIPG
jgi:hypothetical protein